MAVIERPVARVAGHPPRLARPHPLAAWWRSNATALFFMTPAAILVLLFFFVPVVLTLGIGLTDMSTATGLSKWQWVGLDNFERLVHGRFTSIIVLNTIFYVINQLVEPLGVEPRSWLNTDPWLIVIFVNGLVGASLGMLVFTSAMESIPVDLFRAARVDGANAWQIVRRITLPLLKWPILFVLTYQTMSLLASYEYILLTTNGGPGLYGTEGWSLWAFHTALNSYYGNLQIGLGAAMAAILVVLAVVISLVLLRIFRFNDLVGE